MRIVLVVIALCLGWGNVMAQADVPRARGADSTAVRDIIYKRLFAGITQSSAEETKAKAVIASAFAQTQAVMRTHVPDVWERMLRIEDVRDSTLRAMVKDSAQRAKFDQRAAEMRPHN